MAVTMLSAILHDWGAMTWNAEAFITTILILCRSTTVLLVKPLSD
jgi:hypothetical protein